ncbi:hypothetical protein [Maricaulis salignorans]|uniref:hypothetical protein n=1 Tax=Maricaulis salignorans TaxID=144026 RepID=UPI003A944265
MTLQCRFKELKVQLDQAVQDQTSSIKVHRCVDISAHRDFLTLSWLGDLDYWRSHAVDAEVRRRRKLPENKGVSEERLRRLSLPLILKRHAHKQERAYALERVVFFKTANLVPETLEKMAPDCVPGYREAPLHRHIVLARCEKAVDKGGEPEFTRWRVQTKFHRLASDVIKSLSDEIFPKPLPERRKRRWIWLVCLAILVAALGAATAVLTVPELKTRFLPHPLHVDRDELESLRTQLAEMVEVDQALRDQIAAGRQVDAETATRLTELDQEIAALWARLAALPVPGTQMDRIGQAACLPVRHEGDRAFPTFLYAITLDRDASLSLRPLADGVEMARNRGFTEMPEQPASQLGIAAFETLVRPTSNEARARSCRHFVLLIENDPQDAGRYIARREAVERHFYVFRP